MCAQPYRTMVVSLPDQTTQHPPCPSVSLPPCIHAPPPRTPEHISLTPQICAVPSPPQLWLEFKSPPPSATWTLSPAHSVSTEAKKRFSEPKTDQVTYSLTGNLLWSLLSLG